MSNAAESVCPFCARSVDPQIVAYGGKCPSCFGEIPGEEAPTDPGEERRKAQERAAAAQVQRGRWIPYVVVGAFAMIPVAGALFLVLRPTPSLPALNLDDPLYEVNDLGTLVAYAEPKPVEGNPKSPTAMAGDKASALLALGSQPSAIQAGSATDVKIVDANGVPGTPDGPRAIASGATQGSADPTVASVQSANGIAGPSFEVVPTTIERRKQKGVTLTDDDAIIDMALAVVSAELPKLRSCYDRQVKLNESLAGHWTLEFTVTEDGAVRNAAANGKEMSDAGLESCIIDQVKQWEFQPIKAPLPIQKTVTFRAR